MLILMMILVSVSTWADVNSTQVFQIRLESTEYPAGLDNPKNVGQVVRVEYFFDYYMNPLLSPSVTYQRITSMDEMDQETQNYIVKLKNSSMATGVFSEAGGWILFLKNGKSYTSDIAIGKSTGLSTNLTLAQLHSLAADVKRIEGDSAAVDYIDFIHTHLDPGEALSPPDIAAHEMHTETIKQYFPRFDSKNFVTSAVPVNGKVFFSFKELLWTASGGY